MEDKNTDSISEKQPDQVLCTNQIRDKTIIHKIQQRLCGMSKVMMICVDSRYPELFETTNLECWKEESSIEIVGNWERVRKRRR
jgi:hypothetical protein